MNSSKHLPYKAILPYLDGGGKLYFTILHCDTLTVVGAMILYHTQSHTLQAQSMRCATLSTQWLTF